MYCLVCNELIYKEITYQNIFKKSIDKICNKCFVKYLYIQRLEVIPILSYQMYINTLFDNCDFPLALMNFLKPYYFYYLKEKSKMIVLFFDTFDLDVYNIINNLELGDIYLIVLDNKMKKEKDYED